MTYQKRGRLLVAHPLALISKRKEDTGKESLLRRQRMVIRNCNECRWFVYMEEENHYECEEYGQPNPIDCQKYEADHQKNEEEE